MAAGALVALIALSEHTPVWVAALRGAIAFVLVRIASRAGLTLLEGAIRADAAQAKGRK